MSILIVMSIGTVCCGTLNMMATHWLGGRVNWKVAFGGGFLIMSGLMLGLIKFTLITVGGYLAVRWVISLLRKRKCKQVKDLDGSTEKQLKEMASILKEMAAEKRKEVKSE